MPLRKKRRKVNTKNPNSRTWRDKADRAWKEAPGPNYCEVCQSIGIANLSHRINNHHLISRTNLRYRHVLMNRVRLCATHHSLGNYQTDICAHGDSKQSEGFVGWLRENKPEQYQWWMDHKDDKRQKEHTYKEAYEKIKGGQ